MSLTVGETVGAYRIVEQLGQGGMATVFKAYHAALDRYVAIKVLHPAFKEDPNFLARFQREARVVARLEHPNVVPVYDYAEHNGSPYLVMKFVEGETLKARLGRGPLTLEEGLRLVEAVGAGLAYAHRQGILHRDVKPSNIMLGADGVTYIADFGLARIALAGESTLSSDSMLGTPHYMSPEQAKGVKDLDAKTDIYSLGVVMYELVVGRVPYSADTPYAIIHDHIFAALPMPRAVNPNVPEAIERVLLKALAKERGDRYPDVEALVAAFRAASVSAAPGVMALPHAAPVSPTSETPSAAARADATALGAADAPAQAEKKKYKFQWWHAALGLVVAGCCCLGLFAVANNQRERQAQATSRPSADVAGVPTQAPSSSTAQPSPVASPADDLLRQAVEQFEVGRPDEALALLDEAVALDPSDLGMWLRAGDLTLSTGMTRAALEKYYIPGVGLTTAPFDALEMRLHSHAALAFYVSASDPRAEEFLLSQAQTYPEPESPQLAHKRFQIFHGHGAEALRELQAFLQEHPRHPGVLLILGDYYLSAGQPVEAGLRYKAALESNTPAPAWVRLEAECNAQKILNQRANARLEPTCESLSSLLTGR
jgi:Tfp pilus assembly protein PilF